MVRPNWRRSVAYWRASSMTAAAAPAASAAAITAPTASSRGRTASVASGDRTAEPSIATSLKATVAGCCDSSIQGIDAADTPGASRGTMARRREPSSSPSTSSASAVAAWVAALCPWIEARPPASMAMLVDSSSSSQLRPGSRSAREMTRPERASGTAPSANLAA
jgi:hypothetical protein